MKAIQYHGDYKRHLKRELAKRAVVTPSTVYSFLDPYRHEAAVNLIQKLCEGRA